MLALGINWFDFQLSSFSGVFGALPVIPVDAFPCVRVLPVEIKTIQV